VEVYLTPSSREVRSPNGIRIYHDTKSSWWAPGLPGYTIWKDLYLSSSTLIAIKSSPSTPIHIEGDDGESDSEREDTESGKGREKGEEKEWPIKKFIMSDENRRGVEEDSDRWRVVDEDVGRGEVGKRAIRLRGTTVGLFPSFGEAGLIRGSLYLMMGRGKVSSLFSVKETCWL
jgi:hypothetical protein